MAKEPVKIEKSGGKVRLRNLPYALEGCLVTDKEEIRYRIEPNKWTEVRPEVYQELHGKFSKPQAFEVPDWEPGGDGDKAQRTNRTEEYQEYILEFSGDRD